MKQNGKLKIISKHIFVAILYFVIFYRLFMYNNIISDN